MGARNQAGRGLSYRPARLHRLAEFIPWDRFRGPIHVLKYRLSTEWLLHDETKDWKREVHFPDAMALPPQGNGLIESLLLMETKEEKLDAPGLSLRSPSTTKKLIHSLSFILNTNRKWMLQCLLFYLQFFVYHCCAVYRKPVRGIICYIQRSQLVLFSLRLFLNVFW